MALAIKNFYLMRHEDAGGISGTGIVAVGSIFPNGKVVFQWVTYRSSMELYDSIENLIEIHGHGGKTEVIYGCPPDPDAKPKRKKKSKEE
jgi:hypothetical protein